MITHEHAKEIRSLYMSLMTELPNAVGLHAMAHNDKSFAIVKFLLDVEKALTTDTKTIVQDQIDAAQRALDSIEEYPESSNYIDECKAIRTVLDGITPHEPEEECESTEKNS